MDKLLMALAPWISFIKDIVTIVSLTVAAVVAIRGLQTWRKQLAGSSNYDLAKRLLKATYRLRDALQAVRNPLITAEEFGYALKETRLEMEQSDARFRAASTAAVYQVRWKPVIEAYQALELEAVEAEAVWGSELRSATSAMRSSIGSLFAALNLYLGDIQPGGPKLLDNVSRQSFEQIVWSMARTPEEDKYFTELSSSVDAIEKLVKPYLIR